MSPYDNILSRLSSESRWTPENEKAVLEPYEYLLSTPGKEFRTQLIEAFNQWLAVPADTLQIIAKIVNMLHSASLMVDDIEDDSQLRRGKPVTHKVYGVPQTINTGNYVYFLAYRELLLLREPANGIDVEKLVTDELLSLHRGQGLELLWRDSLQCPTEDEYIDMSFRNYIPLVNLIGVFFQIRDDLMNLQSVEYSSNKGFAEDLTEGKFSFPVVHGIHADKSNRQILNVLQKRPATPTLKIHTISYLKERTKSFEYTLDVLDSLERQMRAEIERLGGNPSLMKIVDLLSVDRARLVH
ncbi:isoprenoid synthase domain-containing protein [Schizophyllum fasciatum]